MGGSFCAQIKPRMGDLAGWAQLFFDNLATLLAVIGSIKLVLSGFYDGMPPEPVGRLEGLSGNGTSVNDPYYDEVNLLIYTKTVPGLACAMCFGNLYYALMAIRLGMKEDRNGEVTALPFGINTPGAFAFIFGVLSPATMAYAAGNGCFDFDPNTPERVQCWTEAATEGWKAGVLSNLMCGCICIVLGLFGSLIVLLTPTSAMLTSLAGIGFAFLGFAQAANNFSEPLAGFVPFFMCIALFYGNVNTGCFPQALMIALSGIALGWADGIANVDLIKAASSEVKWRGISSGYDAWTDWTHATEYLGTLIPVAFAASANSLMNVLSAAEAGDSYNVIEVMCSDGFGACVAALLGTPFGTSVYIGHPAYKKINAGVCYALLNCTLFMVFALFSVFAVIAAAVPLPAVCPLIFFVGMMICQEAMASMPTRQYPAFMVGLFPSTLDWAITSGVNHGGIGTNAYFGLAALKPGAILLSTFLCAISIHFIDRKYGAAMGWCIMAAILSAVGLLHQDGVAASAEAWENWLEPSGMLYCQANCTPGSPDPPDLFEKTVKWRFAAAYGTVAVMAILLWMGQCCGLVDPPIVDEVGDADETKKSQIQNSIRSARASGRISRAPFSERQGSNASAKAMA